VQSKQSELAADLVAEQQAFIAAAWSATFAVWDANQQALGADTRSSASTTRLVADHTTCQPQP
jgi:hypothetical protein